MPLLPESTGPPLPALQPPYCNPRIYKECLLNECVTNDRSFPSPAFCLTQLAHLEIYWFCIPNPRGLGPHLCQESYHPWERLSLPAPPLKPQTPNYLQMVLSWSFSILLNALTDPTPSLMTPCCLLLREGRGLAQPGCGFLFHYVRPQGPDPCPTAGLAPRATPIPACSNLRHHVLPISGIPKLPARG